MTLASEDIILALVDLMELLPVLLDWLLKIMYLK